MKKIKQIRRKLLLWIIAQFLDDDKYLICRAIDERIEILYKKTVDEKFLESDHAKDDIERPEKIKTLFLHFPMAIIFKKTNISRNESTKACSSCTNRCCSRLPGSVFPEQLKEITVESVSELLQNGYCIDWWEGDPRTNLEDAVKVLRSTLKALKSKDPDKALEKLAKKLPTPEPFQGRAYFIRPKIKGNDNVFNPTYGGECNFLTATGCSLTFKNRPAECQALVPNEKEPGKCGEKSGSSKEYTKQESCIAWLPYQDIIQQAGDLVESKQTQHA